MNRFLYLVSVSCALSITVVHSAVKTQGEDDEPDKYDRSLHERISRIETIMFADDTLSKRLGALEKEIKRVGEENKLLRVVVENQDSTLKQLTDDMNKLRSDYVVLERFCKETSVHLTSSEGHKNPNQFLIENQPQTNHTTKGNGQMGKSIDWGTEEKFENHSALNQDIKNKDHLGQNNLIRELHVRQTQVGHVAFYSTVSVRNLTNLGMHQTIIFDRVITNNGGAYHPHTGIFIAPLNGVYVFNVGAMSSHMKLEYLELVQDDTFIQGVFPDAGTIEAFASDSLAAVLELNKGNEVWVRTGGGSGEIHGNSFTFFSGWLLYMK